MRTWSANKQGDVEVLVWREGEPIIRVMVIETFRESHLIWIWTAFLEKKRTKWNALGKSISIAWALMGWELGRGHLCWPSFIKEVCPYVRWSGFAFIFLQCYRVKKRGSGRLEKLREQTYGDLHVTYANRVYTLKIPSLQMDGGVEKWIITPCFLDEKTEKLHS